MHMQRLQTHTGPGTSESWRPLGLCDLAMHVYMQELAQWGATRNARLADKRRQRLRGVRAHLTGDDFAVYDMRGTVVHVAKVEASVAHYYSSLGPHMAHIYSNVRA